MLCGQSSCAGEIPVIRLRKPRGHISQARYADYLRAMTARVFQGQERKGSGLARPVTGGATIEQKRRDIP